MTQYNGRVDLLSPMGPFQIKPSQDSRNNTALFVKRQTVVKFHAIPSAISIFAPTM